MNMDDFTELNDESVFKIQPLQPRSYEKDPYTQLDITIEANLSQVLIARDGYTFLDFLADIGGMQGMLFSGIGFFMAIWNYNYVDNYMVERLFKTYKPSDDIDIEK